MVRAHSTATSNGLDLVSCIDLELPSAQAIMEFQRRNGPFRNVSQLADVVRKAAWA